MTSFISESDSTENPQIWYIKYGADNKRKLQAFVSNNLAWLYPIQQTKKDFVTTYEAPSLLSIALRQFRMLNMKKWSLRMT
jgi:hypothetical protein